MSQPCFPAGLVLSCRAARGGGGTSCWGLVATGRAVLVPCAGSHAARGCARAPALSCKVKCILLLSQRTSPSDTSSVKFHPCRASAFLVLLTLPRREVLKKNIQRPSYFDSRANAGKSQCANLVLSTLNKKNTDFSKQNTTKLRAPSKPLEVHGIPFIDSAERWIRQQTRTPHIQRDPYYLAYDCFQFHGPLISYGFP